MGQNWIKNMYKTYWIQDHDSWHYYWQVTLPMILNQVILLKHLGFANLRALGGPKVEFDA